MSHTCPRRGCTRTVSDDRLMCGPDWWRVPKPLQASVYAAYKRGAGLGSEELRAAQDAAVQAAERSLKEATIRFTAGLDPYLNVISAQTIVLTDQQAAVNFRMQQMVASVQLIKAIGGGWDVTKIPSARNIRTPSIQH